MNFYLPRHILFYILRIYSCTFILIPMMSYLSNEKINNPLEKHPLQTVKKCAPGEKICPAPPDDNLKSIFHRQEGL